LPNLFPFYRRLVRRFFFDLDRFDLLIPPFDFVRTIVSIDSPLGAIVLTLDSGLMVILDAVEGLAGVCKSDLVASPETAAFSRVNFKGGNPLIC
jgi:hypothetical protein